MVSRADIGIAEDQFERCAGFIPERPVGYGDASLRTAGTNFFAGFAGRPPIRNHWPTLYCRRIHCRMYKFVMSAFRYLL